MKKARSDKVISSFFEDYNHTLLIKNGNKVNIKVLKR